MTGRLQVRIRDWKVHLRLFPYFLLRVSSPSFGRDWKPIPQFNRLIKVFLVPAPTFYSWERPFTTIASLYLGAYQFYFGSFHWWTYILSCQMYYHFCLICVFRCVCGRQAAGLWSGVRFEPIWETAAGSRGSISCAIRSNNPSSSGI